MKTTTIACIDMRKRAKRTNNSKRYVCMTHTVIFLHGLLLGLILSFSLFTLEDLIAHDMFALLEAIQLSLKSINLMPAETHFTALPNSYIHCTAQWQCVRMDMDIGPRRGSTQKFE